MIEKTIKMPSWEEFAGKVQPGRQIRESRSSLPEAEPKPDKEEAPQEIKRSFLNGIKQKLTATALAGFITLGGGWEKSLADQLKVKMPEKKGAAPEFVLETAITAEKLEKFKEKIRREEPDFAAWLENYKRAVREELAKFRLTVSEYRIGGEQDRRQEEALRFNAEVNESLSIDAEGIIAWDHTIIENLKKSSDFVSKLDTLVEENLDDILWGIILMDDSRSTRDHMVRFVKAPTIKFPYHARDNIAGQARLTPKLKENNFVESLDWWDSEIEIYPSALRGYRSADYSLSNAVNSLIHEIIHTIHPGGKRKESISEEDIFVMLREGITQNETFEIIQYLSSRTDRTDNRNIMPALGSEYDERLVLAEILESIARSSADKDFLVRWHTRLINNQEMYSSLNLALRRLNLDRTVIGLLAGYRHNPTTYTAPEVLLMDVLAKLKMSGINLSPEFLRDILTRGRRIDAVMFQEITDTTVKWGKIIDDRINKAASK